MKIGIEVKKADTPVRQFLLRNQRQEKVEIKQPATHKTEYKAAGGETFADKHNAGQVHNKWVLQRNDGQTQNFNVLEFYLGDTGDGRRRLGILIRLLMGSGEPDSGYEESTVTYGDNGNAEDVAVSVEAESRYLPGGQRIRTGTEKNRTKAERFRQEIT